MLQFRRKLAGTLKHVNYWSVSCQWLSFKHLGEYYIGNEVIYLLHVL